MNKRAAHAKTDETLESNGAHAVTGQGAAHVTHDRSVSNDTVQPILEVSHLNVDFFVDKDWVRAANDINYRVNPGEVLAIVGESGSGKSVSSMSLLGLLPKNGRASGSAKLNGVEMIGANSDTLRRARGQEIAVIFQEPMTALNPVYRIGFQIVEALRVHTRLTPNEAKLRALELLKLVEMPDPQKAFDSYPHQLSGGQRQRAMIAQSLSCDPKMLIADEPTTALDVTVQAEILELMRNLHEKLNSAIVIITHDMGVVADIAHNVIVMRHGNIVERGTVSQIFNNPQHEYTKKLLDAVPHLGNEVKTSTREKQAFSGAPALSLKNVDIEYPKRGRVPAFKAVENASFDIYPGECVGVVGESGSGKTTIARAAVGLLPVAGGELLVAGTNMHGISRGDLRKVRKDIGIVFQDPGSSLNPRWPVGQSIAEPLELEGSFSRADRDKRVIELLDAVELPRSFKNRYPNELSGGQRQRIGIARALALHPKVLVADEPTSALDVSVQKRVLELLQELQDQLKFACMFVSHDLAVVDMLSDRVVVMNHGKIVEQGPTSRILRDPQEDYTKRLIAAVPVPNPEEQSVRRKVRTETIRLRKLEEEERLRTGAQEVLAEEEGQAE